jgi:hypothetical protein
VLAVYGIVGVIVLFCTCFIIPIDIVVDYKSGDVASPTAQLKWLFGLVKFDLLRKRLSLQRRKIRTRGIAHIRFMGFDRRAISSIVKLARRTVRTLQMKKLSGYMKLGLNNPADTAIAFNLIQPIATLLSISPTTSFKIEPVFSERAFNTEIEGRLRVFPFRIAVTGLWFVFSRDGWYLIRYIVRRRRRKRF